MFRHLPYFPSNFSTWKRMSITQHLAHLTETLEGQLWSCSLTARDERAGKTFSISQMCSRAHPGIWGLVLALWLSKLGSLSQVSLNSGPLFSIKGEVALDKGWIWIPRKATRKSTKPWRSMEKSYACDLCLPLRSCFPLDSLRGLSSSF